MSGETREDVAELAHGLGQRLCAKYMLLEGRVGNIEVYLDNVEKYLNIYLNPEDHWKNSQRYRRIHRQLQEKRRGFDS